MSTEEYTRSEASLPAGEYWVGDPCYAFEDHELWLALIDSAYEREPNPRILEADARGAEFIASGTYFGDGTYPGSDGKSYPVDAGLIGIVPVGAPGVSRNPFGMQKVTFEKPVWVEYDGGTITVGGVGEEIKIETNDDKEEE